MEINQKDMVEFKKELLQYKGKYLGFISKGVDCDVWGKLIDVIGYTAKVKSDYGIEYANLLTFQKLEIGKRGG